MLTLYSKYNRQQVQELFQSDYNFKTGTGTWGIQGPIKLPNKQNDWVYFVTYGQSQAGHEFDEGITPDGVLTWQSQPSQRLKDKRILQWINQNPEVDKTYLFLRANKKLDYYYLGNLNYLRHDADREQPVWFQFQITDFNPGSKLYSEIQGGVVPPLPEVEEKSRKGPLRVDPPIKSSSSNKTTTRNFKARKMPDLSGQDTRNKKLGLDGEKFILEQEVLRLNSCEREDLASKIEHTSVMIGDGAGYDIKSYNEDGSQRFIEVKTTKGGINTGFYITPNELAFAELHSKSFVLVRVFNFDGESHSGNYFELDANLEEHVTLAPTNFKASF